jgi:hypothetical protein
LEPVFVLEPFSSFTRGLKWQKMAQIGDKWRNLVKNGGTVAF